MLVRVRFAPSPTGFLHIGGLRTALYNYLFAKQNNGIFILRIEDTDRNRYVEGAVENLIKTMHWSGIEYDEGPKIGGDKGPYFQSKRLNIYKKHILHLIENEKAYPCFYSKERLKKIEKENIPSNILTQQDQIYRNISVDESTARMKNENHVIRLKVPNNGSIEYNDQVRGKLKFDLSLIEDQILMKSDGYPTYHFANVVDDHLMEITHVIRGEEWIASMPKHLLLYENFNWKKPEFIHLPLILNQDKTKLSKRQNDVAVEDYITNGYLKKAFINYLSLLGWHGSGDQELYTLDELIKDFSINRIQKSGAIFDIKKLNWMNNHYIKKLEPQEILDKFLKNNIDLKDQITLPMIKLIYEKIERLTDIPEELNFLFEFKFENEKCREILDYKSSKTVLKSFTSKLEKISILDSKSFKSIVSKIQDEIKVGGKNLWMPLRIAVTGKMHGPDVASIVEILGKEVCLQRLNNIIND
ncbi:MAG: glutamate--tRNA ligase [Candidatus Marinimicrobia bacterium]|nr:glutamate--tRNA ligase [Candidatus Neomarinimicrobiota bacterium]